VDRDEPGEAELPAADAPGAERDVQAEGREHQDSDLDRRASAPAEFPPGPALNISCGLARGGLTMEIDIREVPTGERLGKVLDAVSDLPFGEVLTLTMSEDPRPLMDSIAEVHGEALDLQPHRWGIEDRPWLLHVKKSRRPSAYQPE
jgi:uncharacterized protein (DUF2249 family)